MEPILSLHTPLEVKLTHQRHNSHDSGAFIDWSSEDSGSPTNGSEEFVTVVSVENKDVPSPFVTVLEIGDPLEIIEEVRVYRLPGERLGFGLKFEGGTNTAEKVKRLFIQSSAPDSPASRAKCSWGSLVEGDEILEIDGVLVRDMTRLDCVRSLKESNVCIKLVIRHPKTLGEKSTPMVIAEVKKNPPPIPPRKSSRKTESEYSPVPKARTVEQKVLTRVPSNPKDSPDLAKRVVRRNSLKNPPPEAEVYLDILEDEIRSNWGSESDDTASTISTVVSVTNGSSLDLPTDTVSNDFLFSKICDERSDDLQPPITFQDTEDEVFASSLKNFPEETLVEVDLKDKSPPVKKASLIPRLAKSIGLIAPPKPSPRKEIPETKSRSIKKRPPPPPPPETGKIPYTKKKKSKEDDKKAQKIEKKAKKEKVSEKEEAIVPFFEPPSPEEDEDAKLCWPVPVREIEDVLPVQNMEEFNVEAVTGEPFFLFRWGSSKQLETIGEDEEEPEDDANKQSGYVPLRYDTEEIITPDDIRDASGEARQAQEVPSMLAATRIFLDQEKLFSSIQSTLGDIVHVIPTTKPTQNDEVRLSETSGADKQFSSEISETIMETAHLKETAGRPDDASLQGPVVTLNESGGCKKDIHDAVTSTDRSNLKINGDLKKEMDVVGSVPPPSFNRLPPDGHEFPQKYREEVHEIVKADLPPLPVSEPPRRPLVQILPSKHKVKLDWRQDERSGKSVRDKIAMFQSVPDAPVCPAGYTKLSKYKSSDDVFCDDEDRPLTKPFSRSAVSIDRVGGRKSSFSSTGDSGSELGARTQSSLDLTSCSSSAYSSSCSPDSSLSSVTSSYLGYASTLPRKASTTETIKSESKPRAVTRTSSFNVHSRSQSMLDINPLPQKSKEDKSSLNNLVEQRRRTLSKLRGLVIPEKSSEPAIVKQPIIDLPEIKSKDLFVNKTFERERRISTGSCPPPKPAPETNLTSPPWKLQDKTPAIPKYSPAFKRKNISVYSTTDFKFSSPNAPNKPPRSNGFSPRYSLDSKPKPDSTTEHIFKGSFTRPNDFPQGLDYYGRKSLSDRSRSEEDSDNDSAVSSSRSSISPPASPLLGGHHLDLDKTPLARTLSSETTASGTSTASTLTSGSHPSSDSDSHSKRILKAQSVEAINRKNVLTSAKYSRGFDVKNGSPLIKRKLIEDSLGEKITDCLENNEGYPKCPSDEIVNYKLAGDYKSSRTPDVKIAFLNHVDYEETYIVKKKVEKTESTPVEMRPHPIPRRVSAPLSTPWSDDWNQHSPLGAKISAESARSLASSVDTIVESPLNETPSRMRMVESEGTFLDEVDSIDEFRPKIGWAKDDHRFVEPLPVKKLFDESENEKSKVIADRMTARNRRSVSVNDIRKAFEKAEISLAKNDTVKTTSHARVSSLDSTTSDDSMIHYDTNLQREQFGSITSLASSTSLISPQELQSLIDEANLTLEETTGVSGSSLAGSHDVLVVILHRDSIGGSVGITLAGGADYEAKEITVHKVLAGSPADRDGRIQKGDRILSINGKSMKGATHRESLAILKQPRPEVVLVVSRLKAEGTESSSNDDVLTSGLRSSLNGGTSRPPRILEGALLTETVGVLEDGKPRGPPTVLQLVKDGAGLGFSLEGGKDSPLGDRPLVVKKIFTGGAAEKSGLLKAGDEILNVNGVDVSQMSRIEAWKLMKRIPDGNVSITIRRIV